MAIGVPTRLKRFSGQTLLLLKLLMVLVCKKYHRQPIVICIALHFDNGSTKSCDIVQFSFLCLTSFLLFLLVEAPSTLTQMTTYSLI